MSTHLNVSVIVRPEPPRPGFGVPAAAEADVALATQAVAIGVSIDLHDESGRVNVMARQPIDRPMHEIASYAGSFSDRPRTVGLCVPLTKIRQHLDGDEITFAELQLRFSNVMGARMAGQDHVAVGCQCRFSRRGNLRLI